MDGEGIGPDPRRLPTWMIVGALAVVAVPTGAYAVFRFAFDDTATPVATEEVVEEFREEATARPSAPTMAPIAPEAPRLPAPGVYVYRTVGSEEIDALGGAHHDYPAETTVTVRATDCGATLRWVALEERSETLDLCLIDDTLVLRGYVADHEFFGQDDHKPLICDAPVALLGPGLEPAMTEGICRGAGLVEELSVVVGPTEATLVAGTEVRAVPIDIEVVVGPRDGHTQGVSSTRLLIDPSSGVLVGWSETTSTTADSQVGSVDYEETFDLRLTDLQPRT